MSRALTTGGEGALWAHVDALFTRALELDPEDRPVFFDEVREADAALRRAAEGAHRYR